MFDYFHRSKGKSASIAQSNQLDEDNKANVLQTNGGLEKERQLFGVFFVFQFGQPKA
jgi:hypothetical protein